MHTPRVFSIILLFSLIIFVSKGQSSSLLTGEIIGTKESVDYRNFQKSESINTIHNVFDNDFNTYFASYERSNTWVGLDLGSKHVITKIGFSPRIGHNSRVQLAVIEGANQPDFGDALPLYLIPDRADDNKMTYVDINNSKGYRYVRYVTPYDVRCNLSELQFYGYKGEGNTTQLYQPSNLPVVVIHTVNNEDVVVKEKVLQAIVSVVSDGGTTLFSDSTEVRGRGNASWDFEKKPYRLKLHNKASLVGLPAKAKKWTLINNHSDKTLMRNLLAFDISKRFDMTYTPAGIAVDVMLNGEYKGTYQLSDQVEVNKNRVAVTEMKEKDNNLPELSGGYLIEIDAYAYDEISWFISSRGVPVTIKSPKKDEITPQQRNYVVNYFNQIESLIYSSYMSEEGGFRTLLDTESFMKNFLIGEFCGNTDTYWSTYMYKERNDDKFYTGPSWDYDLAFENDRRTYPINSMQDFIFRTKGSAANSMVPFVDKIITSERSKEEISAIWVKARESGRITTEAMYQLVDSLATEIYQSQELNFKRWPILNSIFHQIPMARGSFDAEVNAVKSYLRDRIVWMDAKVIVEKDSSGVEVEKPLFERILASNGVLRLEDFDYKAELYVYDLKGQLVANQLIYPNESVEIALTPGVYILRILNMKSQESKNHKLLIR